MEEANINFLKTTPGIEALHPRPHCGPIPGCGIVGHGKPPKSGQWIVVVCYKPGAWDWWLFGTVEGAEE